MITNAILYSYRRPEMTELAIQRIIDWNSEIKVHVSIDGLLGSADDQEKDWRQETIRRTEKLAESYSNVIPHIWNVNKGLTEHVIRIADKVFEETNAVLSLEEDNFVSNQGFDFLAKSTASELTPGIASAYTSQQHKDSTVEFRFTLFPEQWATAFNLPIYEMFKSVWFNKRIEKNVVTEMLKQHFKGVGFYNKIVAEKWYRMFSASVKDDNYCDALMTYSAFALRTPYQVPNNSQVQDLGSQDLRGLHPRLNIKTQIPHTYEEISFNDANFCSVCERNSTGISGLGIVHVAKYVGRKSKSMLTLAEMQPKK